jgi:hypothetical protein
MIIYGLWNGISVGSDVKAERFIFALAIKFSKQEKRQ